MTDRERELIDGERRVLDQIESNLDSILASVAVLRQGLEQLGETGDKETAGAGYGAGPRRPIHW